MPQLTPRRNPFDRALGVLDNPVIPAELLVIAGIFSIQTGAGIATNLMHEFGPLPVVAMRTVFGAAMLFLMRPPRRAGIPAHAWRWAILLGLTIAAMNVTFYEAISRIPLGVAVTVEFLGPLGVAVLTSRRPRDIIWAVLAAAGVLLLAGGRMNANDALGVGLALLAGVLWGAYILVGARASRSWPDGRGLTVSMFASTCVIVPAALIFSDVRPVISSPQALGTGLLIAFLSTVLLFSLEMAAMRRLRTSTFGVLLSLEPAIAAVVGLILLGQELGITDIVAIVLVAAASAGASWAGRSATEPRAVEAHGADPAAADPVDPA